MTALSVHSRGRGMTSLRPRRPASSPNRSRSRELHATPPQATTHATPSRSAARKVLPTSVSTTASWNDAHVSCRSASASPSGYASQWVRSAVLSPEKEKSGCSEWSIGLGNGNRSRTPSRASRSMRTPPGYPRPSSFATLSKASPAASSRVCPSGRYSPLRSHRYSAVWPPEATSPTKGPSTSSSTKAAARCASRWWTGTRGLPRDHERAFAKDSPTSRAPARPGPWVTATASRSARVAPASRSARSTTGTIASAWARHASSGTMPPYCSCSSAWLATTSESTSRSPRSTAAAVSSQEVSMARIRVSAPPLGSTVRSPSWLVGRGRRVTGRSPPVRPGGCARPSPG